VLAADSCTSGVGILLANGSKNTLGSSRLTTANRCSGAPRCADLTSRNRVSSGPGRTRRVRVTRFRYAFLSIHMRRAFGQPHVRHVARVLLKAPLGGAETQECLHVGRGDMHPETPAVDPE
jgi:hypothetical protein